MNAQDVFKQAMIKKGDFVTVRKWLSHPDNSYKGDCLEVMVVDTPFIRVKRHTGWNKGGMLTLNLEQVELHPLSPEFVQSVIGDQNE